MIKKKRVCVIGATGSVGQEFLVSLDKHAWFELVDVAASSKSAGKSYKDAITRNGIVEWGLPELMPEYIKNMTVKSIDELEFDKLDLVFSAVESEAARDIETKIAQHVPVISTSSAYRYEEDVPILIPGINDAQADLLDKQSKNRNWKGWVAPLPNCTTTGLVITLKPLLLEYGVKRVMMTSMQAISGGGKTGVSAMGITDNILPWIPKEEDKVKLETNKILGSLQDGKIQNADIKISCTCTRVPILDGHTESVFVETDKPIEPHNAKDTFENYNHNTHLLPSAPEQYYAVHLDDKTRPQPRMERLVGGGMTTTIGRLEKEHLFENGIKYMLFSHNKKMGSAKGAVLLAEMLLKQGKF